MLRNLLILPDGTELFSGAEADCAIQSVTLTQCVNADKELTLGSVCASALEAKLITPGGGLSLTAGEQVTLYKVEDSGARRKQGVFTLEKPTRTTANTMLLTGYDNMTKLDKDLTQWLAGLNGWPYNILTFAAMVCGECGLTFVPGQAPNQDFSVEQFSATGVTGRQLMKWIAEVMCSFCRANADGNIELGWYTPLTTHAIGYKEGQFDEVLYDGYGGELTFASQDVESSRGEDGDIRLDSDRFTVTDDAQGNVVIVMSGCIETIPYFQKGLDYEEYTVQSVDGVQLQLSGEEGYRWPDAHQGANTYVIQGNPLLSSISDETRRVLDNIKTRLAAVTYTPCKVSVPAALDIKAGDILSITDKNGKKLTVYAMTATTAGQKLTVECTGSHRRDSAEALNNPSQQQMALGIAQTAAAKAVDGQTQQDIFNKLTQNGKLQGLYMKDGQLYVNASYLMSGVIDAAVVKVVNLIAEKLTSTMDKSTLSIDGSEIRLTMEGCGDTVSLRNWSDGTPYLYMRQYDDDGKEVGRSQFGACRMQIGGTWASPILGFYTSPEGEATLSLSGTEKTISWKNNGDGTFTLIGK